MNRPSLVTHTSIATFGYIPWGRKILGNVRAASPTNACSVLTDELETDYYEERPVILARRGGCPFVQMAHYAQLAGAKMLLIADNQYEDVDFRLMVDDGTLGNGDENI